MEQPLNRFVDTYTKAIKENNAAIFAGAGLSIAAGFVNWKNLLRDIATELNLDVDKEQTWGQTDLGQTDLGSNLHYSITNFSFNTSISF